MEALYHMFISGWLKDVVVSSRRYYSVLDLVSPAWARHMPMQTADVGGGQSNQLLWHWTWPCSTCELQTLVTG